MTMAEAEKLKEQTVGSVGPPKKDRKLQRPLSRDLYEEKIRSGASLVESNTTVELPPVTRRPYSRYMVMLHLVSTMVAWLLWLSSEISICQHDLSDLHQPGRFYRMTMIF
jgi:hypothetical protein